jgi:hypothetical protein
LEGFTNEVISKLTKLTDEQINEIRKSIKNNE